MPLKAFRADGSSNLSDIVQAVYYAVDHQARVINMSFAMTSNSPELAKALAYATAQGVICVASAGYQEKKLGTLGFAAPPLWDEAAAVFQKACICTHLGNPALLALGIEKRALPVAVCPGPNLAYFDRTYRLEEMVDHIYGRGASLTPADRPHMFAKELKLYVDHWQGLTGKKMAAFRDNLLAGIAHYRTLLAQPGFPAENLESLRTALDEETARLQAPFVIRGETTPAARENAPSRP